MKKQILSFAALLLALLLAGCAASSPQSGSAASASASASSAQPESAASGSADAQAVTFNDTLGRTVTVESPKRVAALIGSFADVWCLAGGKDPLVAAADDTWTQSELGLPETVVNLGGVKEPSAEALLAAQPDFVIGSAKTAADVDLLPTLEQAGIRIMVVSNSRKSRRVPDFCEKWNIPWIRHAGKPNPKGIRKAMERMDETPEHTAMAGDQTFTDILGANPAGVTSILAYPLYFSNPFQRIRYGIERPFIAAGRKKRKR